MIAQTGLMLADGRYRLVSRIAVGGMGEVWRAHDLQVDGPVAIKVLRQEFTGDETSLKRLRIEARNASMLNHPNITTVHDYREHEGTGYLVMEYVDGQSLADVVAAHAVIAPMRLLPILIQSALGLHAAHSAGVVHRDVKPGNILLGPSDHVKLTDFGISVAHGQLALTDTGKVMGTAQYLAPEQALGNAATPAGDLYSLGVIAYEALAGRRPFSGANYVAIALSQVNDTPPPLPGTVERSLAALVMQLLDKDPAARPAGGGELARLFGEALETHRHLASRLLASRSGVTARPLLASERPDTPPHTAEQPASPIASLLPPPAPATDVGPVVDQVAPTVAAPLPPDVAAVPEQGDRAASDPANGHRRARAPGARPRPRRGQDVPALVSALSQAPPAPLPLPSTAELAKPLDPPLEIPPDEPKSGLTPTAPPSFPPQRFAPRSGIRARDWFWAILAGAGLLIIILIGLLTVITANAGPPAPLGQGSAAVASTTTGRVSIVSTVPALGLIMER
ncbi:MAG: protein kinase [Bifidobacteriaceae bacterium]|jgi:serine/threonine-protein kinase|nr:protein kinase [Bifidobacteriaceae bacterium]